MKDKNKIIAMGLVLSAILMVGALFVWTGPCEGTLTTVDGNTTFMKCHYLIAVGSSIALLCVAFAISILKTKNVAGLPLVVLGIITILMTFDCALGIGVCQKSGMICHSTAMWMRITGIIIILCGLFSFVDLNKQL